MVSPRRANRSKNVQHVASTALKVFGEKPWTVNALKQKGACNVPNGVITFMHIRGFIRKEGVARIPQGYVSSWVVTNKGKTVAMRWPCG
jgi:hypothetical protein